MDYLCTNKNNIILLKRLYFFFILFCPFLAIGQIPPYYNGVDFNTTGIALLDQLANLIAVTHTTDLPYTSSSTDTWDAVRQTDAYPEDSNKVLLIYGSNDFDGNSMTDYTRYEWLSCHTTECSGLWNREHVFARSLASPSLITDFPGSGTDVHNLRACDGDMNVTRSNRLFEDSSGAAHITNSGLWYPGDECKGDVARIIMYMYLRYPSQCPANNVAFSSHTYHIDMPDIFLEWNAEDPVTTYETQRNTVLQVLQGNRNPFIDDPYLATLIWGGPEAEDTWGVLGTENHLLEEIHVYPTLVHERLYISSSTIQDYEIAVYNLSGQRLEVPLENNVLQVEGLSSGLYILHISSTKGTIGFKFLKT